MGPFRFVRSLTTTTTRQTRPGSRDWQKETPMPRDLFGDVTRPSISIGSRKWYTLPVSLVSHSVAVGLLIAVPILAPSMLPEVWSGDVMAYLTNIIPPAPPPPVIRRHLPEQRAINPHAAPIEAPRGITKEPDVLPTFENDTTNASTVIGDVKNGPGEPAAPPPAAAPVEPVRVG